MMLAWLKRLFGYNPGPQISPADYLPGERARVKQTKVTAQQLAWREVSSKVADRRLAKKPDRSSEFARLLNK